MIEMTPSFEKFKANSSISHDNNNKGMKKKKPAEVMTNESQVVS